MLIGMSRCNMPRLTIMGATAAEVPIMTKVLKMLLPTMLPTLMSPLPWNELITLTTNSGRLVPRATMVSPMTSSLTFQRRATFEAESVNLSAPHITSAMPATSRRRLSIMNPCLCNILRQNYIKYGIFSAT